MNRDAADIEKDDLPCLNTLEQMGRRAMAGASQAPDDTGRLDRLYELESSGIDPGTDGELGEEYDALLASLSDYEALLYRLGMTADDVEEQALSYIWWPQRARYVLAAREAGESLICYVPC